MIRGLLLLKTPPPAKLVVLPLIVVADMVAGLLTDVRYIPAPRSPPVFDEMVALLIESGFASVEPFI